MKKFVLLFLLLLVSSLLLYASAEQAAIMYSIVPPMCSEFHEMKRFIEYHFTNAKR